MALCITCRYIIISHVPSEDISKKCQGHVYTHEAFKYNANKWWKPIHWLKLFDIFFSKFVEFWRNDKFWEKKLLWFCHLSRYTYRAQAHASYPLANSPILIITWSHYWTLDYSVSPWINILNPKSIGLNQIIKHV